VIVPKMKMKMNSFKEMWKETKENLEVKKKSGENWRKKNGLNK